MVCKGYADNGPGQVHTFICMLQQWTSYVFYIWPIWVDQGESNSKKGKPYSTKGTTHFVTTWVGPWCVICFLTDYFTASLIKTPTKHFPELNIITVTKSEDDHLNMDHLLWCSSRCWTHEWTIYPLQMGLFLAESERCAKTLPKPRLSFETDNKATEAGKIPVVIEGTFTSTLVPPKRRTPWLKHWLITTFKVVIATSWWDAKHPHKMYFRLSQLALKYLALQTRAEKPVPTRIVPPDFFFFFLPLLSNANQTNGHVVNTNLVCLQ